LIAEAFYLTGDIEKYDTGFIRLRRWLKEYPGLEIQINDLKSFIRTSIVSKNNSGVNDTDNVNNKCELLILKIIKDNNQISTNELAQKLEVTKRTIELKKLETKPKTQNTPNPKPQTRNSVFGSAQTPITLNHR
jgi:ATP-dependent DNA helicase RecG